MRPSRDDSDKALERSNARSRLAKEAQTNSLTQSIAIALFEQLQYYFSVRAQMTPNFAYLRLPFTIYFMPCHANAYHVVAAR